MSESRSAVAWAWGQGGKRRDCQGAKETLLEAIVVFILTVAMVSQVYTYGQTHQVAHFNLACIISIHMFKKRQTTKKKKNPKTINPKPQEIKMPVIVPGFCKDQRRCRDAL